MPTLSRPSHSPVRRLLLWCGLLCLAVAVGACRRGRIERSDAAESLETPVTEALMRHVLETCPLRQSFDSLTVVLGELLEPATAEFENRFADTGLHVIPHRRLVSGAAGGKIRIFEPDTQRVPVVVQVSEMKPADGRDDEWIGVAAWAWKEEFARARYRVTRNADGTYAFEKLEDIPIVPRTSDP